MAEENKDKDKEKPKGYEKVGGDSVNNAPAWTYVQQKMELSKAQGAGKVGEAATSEAGSAAPGSAVTQSTSSSSSPSQSSPSSSPSPSSSSSTEGATRALDVGGPRKVEEGDGHPPEHITALKTAPAETISLTELNGPNSRKRQNPADLLASENRDVKMKEAEDKQKKKKKQLAKLPAKKNAMVGTAVFVSLAALFLIFGVFAQVRVWVGVWVGRIHRYIYVCVLFAFTFGYIY